jgi:ferredoxin
LLSYKRNHFLLHPIRKATGEEAIAEAAMDGCPAGAIEKVED